MSMESNKQTKAMRRLILLTLPSLFFLSLLLSLLNSINLSFIHPYINRKSMFLFCNAILLFVARDAGLLLAPCAMEANHKASVFAAIKEKLKTDHSVGPDLEKVVAKEEKNEQELVFLAKGEASGDQESMEVGGVEEEINEEEEEEEELGVDEFNKICEEFIEKIKRERQIEATQLVVMA